MNSRVYQGKVFHCLKGKECKEYQYKEGQAFIFSHFALNDQRNKGIGLSFNMESQANYLVVVV